MRHPTRIVLAGLLTVAAILGAHEYLSRISSDTTTAPLVNDDKLGTILSEPYVDQGPGSVPGTIHLGGVIHLHTHFRRDSRCPATVIISLTKLDDTATTILDHRSNWLPQGEYAMSEKLILPPRITPGDYRLVKKAASYCEPFQGFRISANLIVKVIARDDAVDHLWPEN